ncbi:MAG: hypothetical protein HRU19_01770 [Pseudobacteriovorax sp.]|nr:hypothetical protein [Pseudobacteriovorax sp.]
MNEKLHTNQGFSLISTMFGLALAAFAVVGLMKALENNNKFSKAISLKSDLGIARAHLYETLDCGYTLPPAVKSQCERRSKVYFPIKTKNNTTILRRNNKFPADGTKFGEWHIRASCGLTDEFITIEARRAVRDQKGVTELDDPLTGKTQGEWRDLFTDFKLCNEYLKKPESPIEKDDLIYLEFYRNSRFKANGGELTVKIEKIGNDAQCYHELYIDGRRAIGKNEKPITFKVRQNQQFRVQIKLSGKQCEKKKQKKGNPKYMDLIHENIIVSKPGRNLFNFRVEDSTDFDYNDSVWRLTATPK